MLLAFGALIAAGIPVLLAAYRAVLGNANVSIFLLGLTGVFKTQLAALGAD